MREIGTSWDRDNRNIMNENFKESKNRVDNLILNTPQPSEVVDIRVDEEGNLHTTAKERIDSEASKRKAKDDELTNQLVQTSTEVRNNANNINSQFIDRLLSGQVTKIKLIGDSITAGVGAEGYVEGNTRLIINRGGTDIYETGTDWNTFPSWANLFRKYINTEYPTVDFFNAGVPGISTREVAQLYLSELVSDTEDVVFVMLGMNDRTLSQGDALGEYKQNMITILNYLKTRCNILIVMTPQPALSDFEDATYTNYKSSNFFGVREIDNILTDLCRERGLTHISHYRGLLDYITKKNVKLTDVLETTGSHPLTEGHKVMWQLIQQRLGFSNDINEWAGNPKTPEYNIIPLSDVLPDFNPSKFPLGTSFSTVSGTNGQNFGFPNVGNNYAGTLITNKPSNSINAYIHQYFVIYRTNEIYFRYYNENQWNEWTSLNPIHMNKTLNSVVSSTPLTNFSPGKISYHQINASNTEIANFPESAAGTLTTNYPKEGWEDWGYQEYRIIYSNNIYKRWWIKANNQWSAWGKIAGV